MKLSGSLERAQAIKPGQHAKARDMHYDLENELEHGLYDEDEADEGERAIAHLEAHHPGVREASRGLTRPPRLSSSAKRNIDGPDDEPEREEDPERERERPAPPPPSRSGAGGAGRRHSGGSGARRAPRVVTDTGEDLAGAVITGLKFLLAAGLAYQVLQPKGSGAFSSVLSSIESGVGAFVRPVDPFASSSAAPNVTPPAGLPTASGFPNVIDTPTGTAPYDPSSLNLGGTAGNFNTAGGTAPYKPPTNDPGLKVVNFPATGPAASHVKQPSSPLTLNIRVPALF